MHRSFILRAGVRALALALPVLLSACGGNSATTSSSAPSASNASAPLAADAAPEPTYHLAPAVLDVPAPIDSDGSEASVYQPPHAQNVLAGLESLGSARLDPEMLLQKDANLRRGGARPASSTTTVVTYTPAQIRSAYGLPSLAGVNWNSLSASAAASFGSGQTVYIVDAYSYPNVTSDLATFDRQFGLPACSTLAIAPTAALPLAPAKPGSSCQLAIVAATPSNLVTGAGHIAPTLPAANTGWATEIAMDVEWVHATAPLARIILIEAQDNNLTSLIGAIHLAESMGPGVVNMSFASPDGPYVPSYDAVFSGTGMSFVASSGDSGTGTNWPAVSSKVLAVGGTSVTVNGTAPRSEIAWSGSGGGVSPYEPRPSWQPSFALGGSHTTTTTRQVPDVSFNANPYTGQYIYVTPSTAGSWYSGGGTSISAPQWAGLIAMENAERALSGKTAVSLLQTTLYGVIYPVPGSYATSLFDVKSGTNGSCATCAAVTGYDLVTGLGTPNANYLLPTLTAH